ncbi:hypothetical protein Vafri_14937 [Volvox africanus]|uniref:V-type proton ATPase subunit a n=1 Tax=Volvox africanus TaxID=51714 RepID=A0A8J4BF35_9CHLO|nr:hypothetical protein Vafri_14937 [Volvox africanus]
MPVGQVLDPATGERVDKVVFVVFFAGERARVKIGKICEAFGANRYPLPEEPNRQRAMAAEVGGRLTEMRTTLEVGDLQRGRLLNRVAADIDAWMTLVRKEKAVYHTLNKCNVDVTRKVLVAEAWVPSSARQRVQEALRAVADTANQVGAILQPLASHENPPTYFKTNKFTSCFQSIVDAYGIARYREVNPAVFTIATFPFLFAVMFGDLGHGLLMTLFAAWLLINEKKFGKQQLNDMFQMLYGGRYCILLMGLFSMYVGVLYNEFFSMPMALAGKTAFVCLDSSNQIVTVSGTNVPIDNRDCTYNNGTVKMRPGAGPYPFGLDPIWHGTKTELPFLNSMKMKMSILLGVAHMNLGIIMSLLNNNYFRDRLSTLCEFVPQMIFLNGLFGYLSALIVGKWVSGSLVDLYHVMIYMFLSPGTVDQSGYLFRGQDTVQVILLLVSLVAVPWMLLPKPLILKKRAEAAAKTRGEYRRLDRDHEAGHGSDGHGGGHGEHFDFGEVMVHQMIHTIEFVLGAVSNTASYLRLWALSLAHSQLSAVFYDRVLMMTVEVREGGVREGERRGVGPRGQTCFKSTEMGYGRRGRSYKIKWVLIAPLSRCGLVCLLCLSATRSCVHLTPFPHPWRGPLCHPTIALFFMCHRTQPTCPITSSCPLTSTAGQPRCDVHWFLHIRGGHTRCADGHGVTIGLPSRAPPSLG